MKQLLTLTIIFSFIVASLSSCSFLDDVFTQGSFITGDTDTDVTNTPSTDENLFPYYDWDSLDLKVINSIDKLNYYSALRLLSANSLPEAKSSDSFANNVSLLVTYDENGEIPFDSTDAENPDTPNGSSDYETEIVIPGIVCYALMPDDVFSFEKVSMFSIELTDEAGFLASKLGLGTVEVVITENCIWGDSLITFRNGDNFYSCLLNGTSYNQNTGGRIWQFSTHKFVSGFYIVKNIEQENYTFNVETDAKGQVTVFTCAEFKVGGSRADQNVLVTSETVISTDGVAYTVRELDAYYKAKKENEVSDLPTDEEIA